MSGIESLLGQVDAIKAILPQLEEALREKATRQAVDGGAAVAVRPWSFRHPLKGQTDPWFGLAYHDWLRLRQEGFRGVYQASEATGSGREKLMIIFDRAAEFLAARADRQAARGIDRSESTAGLRIAKRKEGAA